jgi:hypothetical protein
LNLCTEKTSFGLSAAVTSQHNTIADTKIRVSETNNSDEMEAPPDQKNKYVMKTAKQKRKTQSGYRKKQRKRKQSVRYRRKLIEKG